MLTLSYLDLTQPGLDALVAGHATTDDRHASERFRPPRRRLQALAGRALLRRQMTGLPRESAGAWQLVAGGQMQPQLVSADKARRLAVSLAHSGERVAALIADAPAAGIDIEQIRPGRPWPAMADSIFGAGEKARCRREGIAMFYRIWTLREALAKACGIGFPMVVDGRDRFAEAPADGAWTQALDGATWLFATRILPDDYAIAVALREPLESADAVAALLATLA